jgi:hypothetical protein
MSPISVTRGLVDDGDTIGTPSFWATWPPAIEIDDETSPSTATTFSLLMRRVTTVPPSEGFDAVSSVLTSTLRPLTPPAALRSSSAMRTPLSVD